MTSSPWLDLQRFPGRAWLAALARSHQPLATDLAELDLAEAISTRWAARLGVAPEDLLLSGSDEAACRLVLTGLLAPGDVALVAEPTADLLVGGVLAAGARYLDLGRCHDGAIDPAAVQRALAAHPAAVVVVEAPSLFATDDRAAVAGCRPRALVVDARHDAGWAGPRAPLPAATATLVALRDPDEPGVPLLHAVVCAAGTGPDLRQVQGRTRLPPDLLLRALAVLTGLQAQPGWPDRAEAELARRFAAFQAGAAIWPGATPWPRAGMRAAVACLADDAPALARALQAHLAPVWGHGAHPMRSLVVVDLGLARLRAPG